MNVLEELEGRHEPQPQQPQLQPEQPPPPPQAPQPPADPQVQLLARLIEEQRETRETQRRWREEEKLRQRIPECDGTDADSLKQWLQELSTVPLESRAAVMSDTARGTLLLALQQYMRANPDAQWEGVQTHVIETFISRDHDAVLKEELSKMRRKPFESVTMFSQRFRALADIAYPPGQRQALHNERLCQLFAASLDSEEACQRMTRGGQFPATLEQAMERAQRTDQEAAAYRKLTGREKPQRQDMPMEVDAVAIAAAISDKLKVTPPQPQPPVELQRANTEIAKLKSQLKELKRGRNDRPRKQQYGNRHQNKQCYTCGEYGHLARDCHSHTGRKNY